MTDRGGKKARGVRGSLPYEPIVLFERNYIPEPNSGCWLWHGDTKTSGYGRFFSRGKHVAAHRFSYKYFRGEIPHGMCVCHHCDNPPCVNPEHLFLGTNRDNTMDCARKGRVAIAKLNPEKVKEIRMLLNYLGGTKIAELYGVTSATIYAIGKNKNWTHVE